MQKPKTLTLRRWFFSLLPRWISSQLLFHRRLAELPGPRPEIERLLIRRLRARLGQGRAVETASR